jgi:hypothetical protein
MDGHVRLGEPEHVVSPAPIEMLPKLSHTYIVDDRAPVGHGGGAGGDGGWTLTMVPSVKHASTDRRLQ